MSTPHLKFRKLPSFHTLLIPLSLRVFNHYCSDTKFIASPCYRPHTENRPGEQHGSPVCCPWSEAAHSESFYQKRLSLFISVQHHTGYSLSTAKVEAFCALPCTKLFWKFKPEWLHFQKNKCTWVERQVAFLTWKKHLLCWASLLPSCFIWS